MHPGEVTVQDAQQVAAAGLLSLLAAAVEQTGLLAAAAAGRNDLLEVAEADSLRTCPPPRVRHQETWSRCR